MRVRWALIDQLPVITHCNYCLWSQRWHDLGEPRLLRIQTFRLSREYRQKEWNLWWFGFSSYFHSASEGQVAKERRPGVKDSFPVHHLPCLPLSQLPSYAPWRHARFHRGLGFKSRPGRVLQLFTLCVMGVAFFKQSYLFSYYCCCESINEASFDCRETYEVKLIPILLLFLFRLRYSYYHHGGSSNIKYTK